MLTYRESGNGLELFCIYFLSMAQILHCFVTWLPVL